MIQKEVFKNNLRIVKFSAKSWLPVCLGRQQNHHKDKKESNYDLSR